MAYSYSLVIIKTISDTRSSFVTNQGKMDGINPGVRGTFILDNFSFIAEAVSVNRNYSQWKPINPQVRIPFEKEQLVTYNRAEESVYGMRLTNQTTAPNRPETVNTFNEYFTDRRLGESRDPDCIALRLTFFQGLTSSTTSVDDINPDRQGASFYASYEYALAHFLSAGLGARLEQESIAASEGANFVSQKFILQGEINLYMPVMANLGHTQIYMGVFLGFGQARLTLDEYQQNGAVNYVFGARAGANLPINPELDLILEGGIETMNIEQAITDTSFAEDELIQTTDQTNTFLSIGIRKYL